jgi:hypothetical protein
VAEYRVLRRVDDGSGTGPEVEHARLARGELQPRRLTAVAGSLSLPAPVEIPVPAGSTAEQIRQELEATLAVRALTAAADAPNLFVAGTSRTAVQVRTDAAGAVTLELLAVHGLSAAPADTTLGVTVGLQTVDGDPVMVAWTDRGLMGGVRYTYRLGAIKRVPTGAVDSIVVPGRLTVPLAVVPLDRSLPPAPAAALAWVDEGVAGAPAWVVRLTLQAPPGTTTSVLVERRRDGETAWSPAPLDGGGGWRPWPAGADTLLLHDRTADPAAPWSYRARRRTDDGRTSAPPAETTLAPPP